MSHSQYLSGRSAEVILSDVRPTKARPETLQAVNKLLDELLLLIISSARSIATEKLKAGLLKVLPTPLGKDAILEAEIELRAYQERTAPADPAGAADNGSPKDFPLVPVFELLRMKCEAYSTLSDFDGDGEVEAKFQQRITTAGGPAAPRLQAIAPAALYLTAILEHVCEHVLSNVARVVARDSSRSTAHIQDVYIALCEDETIYNLFKSMKVYEEIEQHSQIQHQGPRARRSRSFSHDAGNSAPPAQNGSGFSLDRSATFDNSEDGFSSVGHGQRSSMNKMFKSNSADRSSSPASHSTSKHTRSESIVSAMRRSADVHTPTADSAEDQEFDNLLKSGNVMKLSLTPDRLQTFETAKEKAQRKAAGSRTPTSPSAQAPSHSSHGSKSLTKPRPNGSGHRGVSSLSSPVSPEEMSLSNGVSRSLSKSSHQPNSVSFAPANASAQIRSRTVSSVEQPSKPSPPPNPSVTRKASLTAGLAAPSAFKEPRPTPSPQRSPAAIPDAGFDMSSGFPKKNRHVKRDSLDDSDDDLPPAPRRKPSVAGMAAKGNGPSNGMTTRDLIDFLSEGPPEISAAPVEPPPKAKSGSRLRSMVSRLTKGSSDNLKQDAQIVPKPIMPPAVRPSASASLNAIKSRAAYAPPPPSQYARPSSPHSSSSNDIDTGDSAPPHVRKPVPAWEPARAPSTPTSPSGVPVTPTRQSTHREATIVKGLPSPAEPESQDSVARPLPPKATPSKPRAPVGASAPISTTVPPAAPVISLPLIQASDLRERMLMATSPLECRLLVDIFLARCGFELPTQLPTPSEPTVAELHDHESSMVDLLLGEGSVLGYATPAPIEVPQQPAVVDAAA